MTTLIRSDESSLPKGVRCAFLFLFMFCCCFIAVNETGKRGHAQMALSDEIVDVAAMPEFSDLLSWLTFINRKDYKLLTARDIEGSFVAVFRDHNSDLVLSRYQSSPTSSTSEQIDVFDTDKRSVIDSESKRFVVIARNFRIKNKNGEAVHRWIDGRVVPLKKGSPSQLRIRIETVEDEKEAVIFEEMVFLGNSKPSDSLLPKASLPKE